VSVRRVCEWLCVQRKRLKFNPTHTLLTGKWIVCFWVYTCMSVEKGKAPFRSKCMSKGKGKVVTTQQDNITRRTFHGLSRQRALEKAKEEICSITVVDFCDNKSNSNEA